MNLHCLGGINVLRGHEPARLVGANRENRKIDRTETLRDVGKIFRVAGVTGEEEAERLRGCRSCPGCGSRTGGLCRWIARLRTG